jgi:hypothetical protein
VTAFRRASMRLLESAIALIVLVVLAGVLAMRGGMPRFGGGATAVDPVVALGGRTPAEALDVAATTLERATGSKGAGFTFQVVSRSTLYAKADGPRIEIPDPADPTKVGSLADEYYIGASIAAGMATPDGFWLQMRAGPDKDAAPDFDKAQLTLAALVRGKEMWRNDGDGWYGSDGVPGIGLDPVTVAKLPSLLRNATDPAATDAQLQDGKLVATVTATGKIADAPGLMAVDAESFTVLVAPIDFEIDDQGRLIELHARMRNTRVDTFDLIVDTVITFGYDAPGPLPDPVPTAPPAATLSPSAQA